DVQGLCACYDTSTFADGTPCGAGMFCEKGVCEGCDGGACAVANPCHVGALSCANAPACNDTGLPMPDGTNCGPPVDVDGGVIDPVCLRGSCTTCLDDAPCTPTDVCHSGLTQCSTGVSVCLDVGPDAGADGTPCGAGMVCTTGDCVSCTPGQACSPSNPCDLGSMTCATGAQCADTGNPDVGKNGTSCAPDHVCDDGACAACTAGLSCTPANLCNVGITSCATGQSGCTDTGQPDSTKDGSVCGGTSMVCESGACVACTTGAPCALPNPCRAGVLDCSSGAPVCNDAGPKADETPCGGGGNVCCGASCVDTASDAADCGRCRHDCQGGACAAGTCQAFVLATSPYPTTIAVDSSGVYFTDYDLGVIVRVSGGTQTVVASSLDSPFDVTLDATSLYWIDTSGLSIMQMPKAGGTPVTVAVPGGYISGIAVDSSSVYWTDPSSATVEKAPLGGGAVTTLFSSAAPGDIAVDATSVYWAWQSGVSMGPLGGGTQTTLAGASQPAGIAVDATFVYWSDQASISRAPIGGGTVTTLVSGGTTWGPVTIDATNLYVLDRGGSLVSVPLAGGSAKTLWSGTLSIAAQSLASDATSLYWPDVNTGGVMKIAKP
ncbi:MAG TPA: hypothetical protein VF765_25395, partial [Polyangiaceae bacterium]